MEHSSTIAAARYQLAGSLQRALSMNEISEAYMGAAPGVISASGLGLYHLAADSKTVLRVHADVSSDFLDEYEDYGRTDDPVLDFVIEHRRPMDSSRVVSPRRWDACGARSALGRPSDERRA